MPTSAIMSSSSARRVSAAPAPAADGNAASPAGSPTPNSHRTRQSTPKASLRASRITSMLRCSLSRLARGADSWAKVNVSSATDRTTAPASNASVLRLRSRTFSRMVGHMLRTDVALNSAGPATAAGVSAASGSGAALSRGSGSGPGSGLGSGLGSGSGSGLAGGVGRGADVGGTDSDCTGVALGTSGTGAGILRAYCFSEPCRSAVLTAALIAASPAGIEISRRVSIRSTRCSSADSVSLAEGSNSRAHTTSSNSRGAVAPRISPNPACTTSA